MLKRAFKRLEDFWYLLATALITVYMTSNLSFNIWGVGVLAAFAGFGIKSAFNFGREPAGRK